jgi:peptidoglycan LD-endopeptidase LytH
MRLRVRAAVVTATSAAVLVALVPASPAQLPPLEPEPTTTTTTAPASTTTTAPPPPSGGGGPGPSDGAPGPAPGSPPEPDGDAPGDGVGPAPTTFGGRAVPPEAQAIIDSVPRTGPSTSEPLVDALAELEALGVPRDEAMRVGMGRFPIAGTATYVHDWLFPRYGPGFRFHLGTDVFAPHGTPIRAPVDGIATSNNQGLGGLTVRVTMADGTYFYLAHLSGLVEGFTNGMAVETGDVVGYVGDSGNARGGAPHLHIGIYPQGGAPIDPKPLLDQFMDEALHRLPAVVQAYRDAGYPAAAPEPAEPDPAEAPAVEPDLPDVPTPDVEDLAADALPTGLLYAAGSNPAGGALALLEAEVVDLAGSIDWDARARSAPAPRSGLALALSRAAR